MADLGVFTTPRRDADAWVVELPDGWQQGRGAYGGLVVAALVRALEADGEPGEGKSLRSLHAVLCGPVQPGLATIRTEGLRTGTGTAFREARLVQGGEIQASALAVFGRARSADLDEKTVVMPAVAPAAGLPPAPIGPPLAPVFTAHFDYRPCYGNLPFTGAKEAVSGAWVRAKARGALDGAALAAVLLDALWPAPSVKMTVPRPIATVAFTMQVIDGFADPDAHALLVVSSDVVHEGYFVEWRELWGADGRLIARNQQTIALIK